MLFFLQNSDPDINMIIFSVSNCDLTYEIGDDIYLSLQSPCILQQKTITGRFVAYLHETHDTHFSGGVGLVL